MEHQKLYYVLMLIPALALLLFGIIELRMLAKAASGGQPAIWAVALGAFLLAYLLLKSAVSFMDTKLAVAIARRARDKKNDAVHAPFPAEHRDAAEKLRRNPPAGRGIADY